MKQQWWSRSKNRQENFTRQGYMLSFEGRTLLFRGIVIMLRSKDVIHRGPSSFWCMIHVPVLVIIPVLLGHLFILLFFLSFHYECDTFFNTKFHSFILAVYFYCLYQDLQFLFIFCKYLYIIHVHKVIYLFLWFSKFVPHPPPCTS